MKEPGEAKASGSTDQNTDAGIIEYRFHDYRLDVATHSLYGPEGELRDLSVRALDTLKLLIEHRGQTLSKNYLLETVWPDTYVQENNLNQVISSIRRALGDSKSSSRFIKTLIGKGYCFIAELEVIHTPPPPGEMPEQLADPDLPLSPQTSTTLLSERPPTRVLLYGSLASLLCVGILGFAFTLNTKNTKADSVSESPNNFVNTLTGGEINGIIPGSVAVIPFVNLSTDSTRQQDTFTLGLHDELITQLSQVTGLKIVSRDSVITPAVQQMPLREISEKLHVESVITGSVMYIENLAHIKLQMLDPTSGVIKWAYDYDIDTASLKDMIRANRDMAAEVARLLEADVSMVTYPEILVSPTQSFEAYRYNMAARRAFNNQDFRKYWSLSKRALSLDPNYQGALYNFARAHFYLSSRPLEGMTTRDHLKRSLESAERLIALAPEKYEGYVLKATVLGAQHHWQEAMAEVAHLKSMNAPLWELQPLAPVLMSLGDYPLSIEILEANMQVEPLNGYGRGFLMAAYEAVGNSMQARMEYEIGEELTPDWWGDVVNFFITLGRGEIFHDLESVQGTSDEVRTLLANLESGDHEGTLSRLKAVINTDMPATSRYVHYAAVAALMGEHGLAIKFLKRSADELPVHLHWIWQPVFRDTWHHPQFTSLLEESGLIDYWAKNGTPAICDTAHTEYFICNL